MSFTQEVKNEMISSKLLSKTAQRAFVSAFLRTCGSIEVAKDKFGFSVTSDPQIVNYFVKTVKALYGEECLLDKASKKGERATAVLVNQNSLSILVDLGILSTDGEELTISLAIGEKIVPDENAFKGYLTGAFLGSGSVTVPFVDSKRRSKTGYHLEIVFSKYVTADDFCSLLAGYGFMPKLAERKDQFVVYFKNVEEIETLIGMCGANSAFLKMTDLQITKGIRNDENRKLNCEMSNLSKSIDASIKQRDDIRVISEVVGLDSLPEQLRAVADARMKNEEMSLQELADMLGVTKSCLTHRLRKLSSIAKTLR